MFVLFFLQPFIIYDQYLMSGSVFTEVFLVAIFILVKPILCLLIKYRNTDKKPNDLKTKFVEIKVYISIYIAPKENGTVYAYKLWAFGRIDYVSEFDRRILPDFVAFERTKDNSINTKIYTINTCTVIVAKQIYSLKSQWFIFYCSYLMQLLIRRK